MKTDPLEPKRNFLDDTLYERGGVQLTEAAKSRRLAWVLSIAGAVPFVVFALLLLVMGAKNPLQSLVIDTLTTYGAVILSFLGGIRWGLAMKAAEPETERTALAASTVPAIVGWFSLLMPVPYVFAVQVLAFAFMGAWDSFSGQRGVFGLWFVKLRTVLTFIVVATLIVGFFATV